MNEGQRVLNKIEKLIDGWCERRCLQPLTYLLHGYPFWDELSEEWGMLFESLEEVKNFCAHDLTPEERKIISELILVITKKRE